MTSLASLLWRYDIVQAREEGYVLTSGERSPLYIDCRMIPSRPLLFREILRRFEVLLVQHGGDCLCGVETAGIPLAAGLATRTGIPMAYVRKRTQDHGRQKRIEGVLGDNCVIIDDVITTGASKAPAIEEIVATGKGVRGCFVVVDRRATPGGPISGVPVAALATLADVVEEAPACRHRLAEWFDGLSRRGTE